MKPHEVAYRAIGKNVGLMTGSKLAHDGDNVYIISGLKASRKYKAVKVTYLDGRDLFTMTFYGKGKTKDVEVTDVYVDQLKSIFESVTSLYTSFY